MKRTNRALTRCSGLPAAGARAGFLVAAVAAAALVLTPLGATTVTALAATTSPTPTASSSPAEAAVGHLVLARIEGEQFLATYLPVDAPLLDEPQLQAFRVRFQLDNATADPITVNPQLEYRTTGGAGYVVVPQETQAGQAFHAAHEWVAQPDGSSVQLPLGADIAVSDLLIGNVAGDTAVTGHHSMGLNPDVPLTLPANSATEEEFTVRLTADADFLTSYDLRITDAGAALPATATATVRVSAAPLSPVAAGAPQASSSSSPQSAAAGSPETATAGSPETATAGSPLATASSDPLASGAGVPQASAAGSPQTATGTAASTSNIVRYALAPAAIGAAASTSIHGPYSLTTDQCGICHRAHTAKGPNLLTQPAPQANLCFTCHDGTGAPANLDVKGQYADPAVLANKTTDSTDAADATRAYYSHDVTAPTTHTLSSDENEFAGVSNRHSECADCHNPHNANAITVSTETPTGWKASGRVSGTSGVSVVNTAGSAPTYLFLNGRDEPLTREYQLCFKCHSGFTTLPSNSGFAPSSALLDKGAEFDPNNASFHPIEAPGTNKTDAMTASLAGSPFTTDSTIRCSNCHAGGQNPTATPPAAGGDLAPHASQFQGILLQNYQDRLLKGAGEGYDPADFALCLACHNGAPFAAAGSNPATNFRLHGKHMTALGDSGGSGTSIDTPGAGEGNAICAECHFRLHSTKFQVGVQTNDRSRLVNFAPNVKPGADGTLSWTRGAPGNGSCTLTCHGYAHDALTY